MEEWNAFLSKFVNVIVDDPPSPYPKKKEGILSSINETHLILIRNEKPEAIRRSDIRRVELARVQKEEDF